MKFKKIVQVAMLSVALIASSTNVWAVELNDNATKVQSETDEENAKQEQTVENEENKSSEERKAEEESEEKESEEEESTEETTETETAEVALYAESEENTPILKSTEENQNSPELEWNEEDYGSIIIKMDTSKLPNYVAVTTYKNGINMGWDGFGLEKIDDEHCKVDLTAKKKYDFDRRETSFWKYGLGESGTYRYSVSWTVDGTSWKSELCPEFVYTRPDKALDVPQNLHWKEGAEGTLEWNPVDGVSSYRVCILKPDNQEWTVDVWEKTSVDLSEIFTDADFTYRIVVHAREDSRADILDSDFSEEITYHAGDNNDKVTESITKVMDSLGENPSAEQIISAKTEIAGAYNSNKAALQIAMQTSKETREQIEKLDKLYADANHVDIEPAEVAEEIEVDSSKISMTGAVLNATPNSAVKLTLSKPTIDNDSVEKDKTYWENNYKNVIQISIDINGIQNTNDLEIPITITMPVPKGIDANKLYVIHLGAERYRDIIEPSRINEDGTVSFTVKHFSEFVFAEKKTTNNSQNTKSDSSYNSSTSSDSGSGSTSSSTTTVVTPTVRIGNSEGWAGLSSEVNKALEKVTDESMPAVVTVNLNGVTMIPVSALKTFAGKNIIVSFMTKEGTVINVNGNTLDTEAPGNISFTTKYDVSGNVSVKIRNSSADITKSITVFQRVNNGTEEAVLNFVNGDSTLIPFRNSIIYSNGYAVFEIPFVNADYIIK